MKAVAADSERVAERGPMSADDHDVLRHIAEQVADCFADSGYAFVEEDKVEGLAAMLGSFLTVAGIPVNPPDTGDFPIPLISEAGRPS
ncbi:hypothetical protein AB0M54_15845 [Actinoplanes sp. NPDC051470]|uniref:hypothetical protein n=1 Tax=Actinoplanes sp. NPDC051470 TaxID=3157224 RepID=UPI0034488AE9